MPKEFFTEQPTKKEVESKLEELEKYPDLRPRLTVAWPITREKEELLEMVNAEEITEKKDIEKIEKLKKSNNFLKRGMGEYLSYKSKLTKGNKRMDLSQKLLSSRKPLFATPYMYDMPKLADKLLKLDEIAKKLQEKYKDKFIGFTVIGSTHKGYSEPKSDIDYVMLGSKSENKELLGKFQELVEKTGLNPCKILGSYLGAKSGYSQLIKEDFRGRAITRLFQGIFFGNRKKLIEFQKQALDAITEKEWNKVRKEIMNKETNLEKVAIRFGIFGARSRELMNQIMANITILRTPPLLEEAREIINKRYEQEVKK